MTQLKRQLKLHAPSSSTNLTSQSASTIPTVRPAVVNNSREAKSSGQDEELRLELALPTEIQAEESIDNVSFTETVDSKESTTEFQTISVEVNEETVSKASPVERLKSEATDSSKTRHSTEALQLSEEMHELDNRSNQHSDLENNSQIKLTTGDVLDNEKELELLLIIENEEREKIILHLNEAIEKERQSVERLQELLAETTL